MIPLEDVEAMKTFQEPISGRQVFARQIANATITQMRPLLEYLAKAEKEVTPKSYKQLVVGVLISLIYTNTNNLDEAITISKEVTQQIIKDDKKVSER